MFSFLVAGLDTAWEGSEIEFGVDRFLEHTDETIIAKFWDDETRKVRFLRLVESFPALLGFERPTGSEFRLAKLQNLRQEAQSLYFSVEWSDVDITWTMIDQNPSFFKIGKWEDTRTHWALKKGDLLRFLSDEGWYSGPVSEPVRAVPRSELISSAAGIAKLGHSAIDRMLLELDIPEMQAPQELGSREARANAIVQFAASHPDVIALSGKRLDVEIKDRVNPSTQIATPRRSFLVAPERPAQLAPVDRIIDAAMREELDQLHGRSEPMVSVPALERAANALGDQLPRIFIVHGRDIEIKNDVDLFLRKIGVEPVILHERDNRGRHLLTKFIEEASTCQAAVILMAAEDFGRHQSENEESERVRQNVVLELGYFIAAVGMERTFMLVKGSPEEPSDLRGVVHIAYDQRWKADLARELLGAG